MVYPIEFRMILPSTPPSPWFRSLGPSRSMVSRLISREARRSIWGLQEPSSRFCSRTGSRSWQLRTVPGPRRCFMAGILGLK